MNPPEITPEEGHPEGRCNNLLCVCQLTDPKLRDSVVEGMRKIAEDFYRENPPKDA